MQNWLITGCSTGLGRALATAVLARGWNVTATVRNPSGIGDIAAPADRTRCLVQKLDVADGKEIKEVVARSQERFGAVDVLVNNAGYGYRAAVEEADETDVRDLFETNFYGVFHLTQAVLPIMRARRRGWVVNISSVAGRISPAGSALYAASKFAVEGLSGGLQKELQPLGINVMLVEPGPFRTNFAGRSLKQSSRATPYGQLSVSSVRC